MTGMMIGMVNTAVGTKTGRCSFARRRGGVGSARRIESTSSSFLISSPAGAAGRDYRPVADIVPDFGTPDRRDSLADTTLPAAWEDRLAAQADTLALHQC